MFANLYLLCKVPDKKQLSERCQMDSRWNIVQTNPFYSLHAVKCKMSVPYNVTVDLDQIAQALFG